MVLVGIVAVAFWPGVTMYDTVAQYGEVLSNSVDDWHPPVMVRLWQLLHRLGPTTSPMFALQTISYGAGFALIVASLMRSRRYPAATATALLALSPLLLGWQMVVLKDAQMLGALLATIGILAMFRLANRNVPPLAITAAVLLLLYATFVRGNALFATVPLAVLLLPTRSRPLISAGLAIVGLALVLGLTPLVNQRLLRAAPSGVAKTEPLFDLAAIAVGTNDTSPSVFLPAERRQLRERHCVKSFFWDPLGDPAGCSEVTDRFMDEPVERLYVDLAKAAAAHPLAYLEHRFAHWNSTERWLVPPGLPDMEPPIEAEPNQLGLGTPQSRLASSWHDAAAIETNTPAAWPIVWTVIAVLLMPIAWRRRSDPVGGLALALLVSAVTLEASFLAISIASDVRYHLWSMTASALGLILLADRLEMKRRAAILPVATLALVIAAGLATRASLPRAPDTYQGMIHSASG